MTAEERDILKDIGKVLIEMYGELEKKEGKYMKDKLEPLTEIEQQFKDKSPGMIRKIDDILDANAC